jgi:hypothetical protein
MENMVEKIEPEKQVKNRGNLFKPGQSGNPAGRPPNAVSVVGSIRKMFADNPEAFQEFVLKYLKDPNNRKHVVEMLDGRPKQTSDVSLSMPEPILGSKSQEIIVKEDS